MTAEAGDVEPVWCILEIPAVWCVLEMAALGRWRQEDLKPKASLSYIVYSRPGWTT